MTSETLEYQKHLKQTVINEIDDFWNVIAKHPLYQRVIYATEKLLAQCKTI